MPTHPQDRFRASAEVLTWQARTRIAVASIAAIGELLLLATPDPNPLTGIRPVPFILLTGVTYVALVASVASIAARRGASEWMVLASLMADVAFVFAMVAGVSSPQYFDRILVFVFFALYPATWIARRRHAIAAVLVTIAGYAALVKAAVAQGAALEWPEELWSLGVFLLVSLVLISEHGHVNDRLARIVGLFSRAEQGDFSQAYDEAAEERPDAVARVGSAYNRVRAQLADMVLTDPLTGCLNRRGFDLALAREVARALRSGHELSLLALDIDHFKSVNDTHGHLAGDMVLRQVGALLRGMAREGDIVARTGGEEFSLILQDTPAAGAHHLASRICDEMRVHRFGDASVSVALSVSVGVAAVDRRDVRASVSMTDALKGRADEALYEAKRAGRDRALVWGASRGVQLDLGVSA
ncbi:MAG TPA: GGDEF domain-containing protein [Gemmatimonadaceae bacterium]|nr:GGDEF domain-containing protein [Gemmatimonadaceae bacterium]